jgi:hypothetical protein
MSSGSGSSLCHCCVSNNCCPDRTCPDSGLPTDLPTSLTVDLSAAPAMTDAPSPGYDPVANPTCYDFSFVITLSGCDENGVRFYSGVAENTCTWLGTTFTVKMNVLLTCFGLLTLDGNTTYPPGDCNDAGPVQGNSTTRTCDPILFSLELAPCFDCNFQVTIGAIEIAPGVFVPVIAQSAPFCLSATVYETP